MRTIILIGLLGFFLPILRSDEGLAPPIEVFEFPEDWKDWSWKHFKKQIIKEYQAGLKSGNASKTLRIKLKNRFDLYAFHKRLEIQKKYANNPQVRKIKLQSFSQSREKHLEEISKDLEKVENLINKKKSEKTQKAQKQLAKELKKAFKKSLDQQSQWKNLIKSQSPETQIHNFLIEEGYSKDKLIEQTSRAKDQHNKAQKDLSDWENKKRQEIIQLLESGHSPETIRKKLSSNKNLTFNSQKKDIKKALLSRGYSPQEIQMILEFLDLK